MPEENNSQATRINWAIASAGACLGLLLSWSLLAGNDQGQVNVLYLLLIYLLIPVLSTVISTLSLIFGKGLNFARLATILPLWSRQDRYFLHKIRQRKLDKHWLFLQSQVAALAFSVASLLVFFLLLLGTDVNFVWRSTLLSADSLQPFLKWVASPWWFWPAAQPDLALLQATQDSRLQAVSGDVSVFSRWWPFILATQLFYSLLLRSMLLVIARFCLLRLHQQDIEKQLADPIKQSGGSKAEAIKLAPVSYQLSGDITVINWAGVEAELLQQLDEPIFSVDQQLHAGPLASAAAQQEAEQWTGAQLLIVKAWEPPMGELADYMQKTRGYLLPLDWQNGQLCPPQKQHLEEWRYFISAMSNWQLYQPSTLNTRV